MNDPAINITANLAAIRERIAIAARRAGRDPESVTLVAASKGMAAPAIRAAIAAGQRLFGENYLQEAEIKMDELAADRPIVTDHRDHEVSGDRLRPIWHFIGRLQSNKARPAAARFAMVETVDRLKLATALARYAAEAGRVLPVLVQVNIGREPQKAGVLPEAAGELLAAINDLSALRVMGLMAMPPFFDDPERARPYFRATSQLAAELTNRGLLGRHGPVVLSMGMSGDFEAAVEEGTTLVRVGTALFGPRR